MMTGKKIMIFCLSLLGFFIGFYILFKINTFSDVTSQQINQTDPTSYLPSSSVMLFIIMIIPILYLLTFFLRGNNYEYIGRRSFDDDDDSTGDDFFDDDFFKEESDKLFEESEIISDNFFDEEESPELKKASSYKNEDEDLDEPDTYVRPLTDEETDKHLLDKLFNTMKKKSEKKIEKNKVYNETPEEKLKRMGVKKW